MARIFLLLLFLIPCLWADREKTDDKLAGFIKKWGDGTHDPRSEPLYISAGALEGEEIEKGVFRILAMEGVHIWQGNRKNPVLELFAEDAVVWIEPEKADSAAADSPRLSRAMVYAEGSVHFRWAEKSMSARQIFFDFLENRGVLRDGTYRADTHYDKRQVPLHLRAERLRIHSEEDIEAEDAAISTCQFGIPHYHFAASHVHLTREAKGMWVESRDNVLYGLGAPLFYLPYLAGGAGQFWPLKSIRIGRSSKFGAFVYTTWGGEIYEAPREESGNPWLKRVRWLFDIDAREKRGAALGPQLIYDGSFPDNGQYRGRVGGYYVRDQKLSELGSGALPETDTTAKKNRYRIYAIHRHSFTEDWQLDMELSHISDRTLLTDFFEKEAREDKEPETYGYLRKYWETQAASILVRTNLNDFQSQVDYTPQFAYQAIYTPVWEEAFPDCYWGSRLEFSVVRRKDDEDNPTAFDERHITRIDFNNTLYYRVDLDPFYLLPFAGGRVSYFQERRDGKNHIDRETGYMGIELSTNFYRVFGWQSYFLDIEDLLHILTPSIRYQWVYENTVAPEELIPYDDMETVAEGQQLSLRVTNRLQTVRAQSIVDYLFFEAELTYWPDRDLGKRGITKTPLGLPVSGRWERFDNLKFDLRWQIFTWFSLGGRAEYNFQARNLETWNVAFAATPAPEWQLSIDTRYQMLALEPRRDDSLTVTVAVTYTPNAKWVFQCKGQYDLLDDFRDREFRELQFSVRRNFHRFALGIRFKRDFVDKDTAITADFYPIDLVDKGFDIGNEEE